MFKCKFIAAILIVFGLIMIYAPEGRSETFSTRVPLNDLGSNTYGPGPNTIFMGGLYSDGSNEVPSDHAAAGLIKANEIQPLCFDGTPPNSSNECPKPNYCFNGNLPDDVTYPGTGCPPEEDLIYCSNGSPFHAQTNNCLTCPDGEPFDGQNNNCLKPICTDGSVYDEETNNCSNPTCWNGEPRDIPTYPLTWGCSPAPEAFYCLDGSPFDRETNHCLKNCPDGMPYSGGTESACSLEASNCPNGLLDNSDSNDCRSPKIVLLSIGHSQTTLAFSGGIEGSGYTDRKYKDTENDIENDLDACYVDNTTVNEDGTPRLVSSFILMANKNNFTKTAYVEGSFTHQAMASGLTSPDLVIVDGGLGGQSSNRWMNAFLDLDQNPICNAAVDCINGGAHSPNWTLYDYVCSCRLGSTTENQVQAIWLQAFELGNGFVSWDLLQHSDAEAYRMLDRLDDIVQSLKARYQNLKTVFITSGEYAGQFNLGPYNSMDPYAYEDGFSFKWLITSQINQAKGVGHCSDDSYCDNDTPCSSGECTPYTGFCSVSNLYCDNDTQCSSDEACIPYPSASLDYNSDAPDEDSDAPWLAWGPYMWADGLTPRSDGLCWNTEDFQTENIHLSCSGVEKYGNELLDFFLTSPFTAPWFTTLPVLNISTPTKGATVQANQPITFSGTSSDNKYPVLGTFIDAYDETLGHEVLYSGYVYGNQWQYELPADKVISGHTIMFKAIAKDSGIKFSVPGIRTITVVDTTPPVVSVTSPAEGATVQANQSVTFSGTSADNESAVLGTFIDVYDETLGHELLYSGYVPGTEWQYELAADKVISGHTIMFKAIAKDSAINFSVPEVRTVTVNQLLY